MEQNVSGRISVLSQNKAIIVRFAVMAFGVGRKGRVLGQCVRP